MAQKLASRKTPHDTPAMQQYRRFKEQHPDCVLFFRMGDFYECFYDDAKIAAAALGLTLTQRTTGIPMAGLPYHSVEGYLRRMIQAGHRVAVCEQMETPQQAKGVVRRAVTRVVTPGTITDEALLDEGRENPIAALQPLPGQQVALAFAELSTGAFRVAEIPTDDLADELARINPGELLYPDTDDQVFSARIEALAHQLGLSKTPRPAWHFDAAEAEQTLATQFDVKTLAGFGLGDGDPVIRPAAALVSYLLETQRAESGRLAHLRPPGRYRQADYLVIDQTSLRSLEVERTLRSGDTTGSLLATLQDGRTPMGKRLLRQWLCYPLTDRTAIEQRQDVVATLLADTKLGDDLTAALEPIQDVARIASRIGVGRPTPRDLVGLGLSLPGAARLQDLISNGPAFADQRRRLDTVAPALCELAATLQRACVESPPAHMREGGLIAEGYDEQLDELRRLQRDTSAYLADYQAELIEETGISSLKLGYNKVFGYYIEVTHAHRERVPDTFTRKQTLKNAERYITPQLKGFEDKVLGASAKAIAREQDLFSQICDSCAEHLPQLAVFADVVAELDVLGAFARRAARYNYCRPQLADDPVLRIDEGRHPVLDATLADRFVANDIHLGVGGDGDDNHASLALITGPNMAGKSTYIRQAALLTLLAHTGSFLPARQATVGLTDRIFTRIGASDEIHLGQSTFMVEMTETANICHHATEKSLVILDEIGRGTSTLDGLALAWAITEHLARAGCRTLFASHYHELTELAEDNPRIVNLNVTVREWKDQVVFLHRIAPGAADRSYGIHVAKIAGVPDTIVHRADELMQKLEVHTARPASLPSAADDDSQLSLFREYVEHPALDQLRGLDLDTLAPLDAFDLLRRLKADVGEAGA